MCRLTVYKGRPLLIGDLITNPNNSLIMQSRDAAFHPLVIDKTHRRNILVNGDGFGVAWYGNRIEKGSCLFKFVTPAWSNSNLRNIGDHVESSLIFAHIRAASSGHDPLEHVAVSHENCHPFKHGPFTFMHNGGIPYFCKIKLRLLNRLHDTFFQDIRGSTDSEHIFALFLTFLFESKTTKNFALESFKVEDISQAVNKTIATILDLCKEAGVNDACSLNLCVTDGINIVVTRFRNASSCPPSLYYNFGSNFVCEDGVFTALDTNNPSDIVISSAPLSKVKAYQPSVGSSTNSVGSPVVQSSRHDSQNSSNGSVQTSGSESECDISEEDIGSWILMPKNHMLIVRGDSNNPSIVTSVKIEPISSTLTKHVAPSANGSTHHKSNKSSFQNKPGSKFGHSNGVSGSNSTIQRKGHQRSRAGSGTFTGAFTKPVRRPLDCVEEDDDDDVDDGHFM